MISEELLVLKEIKKFNGSFKLMIVSYNGTSPRLVKQEFYVNDKDELKHGKLKPILFSDLQIIIDRFEEIKKIMDPEGSDEQ